MPHIPASTALAGITVLDLTRVRSGPTAVRQLADWGADVIKIEMADEAAASAAIGTPRHGSDFQNLQRNRRGLALDLKRPEGIAVFDRLAARADVVVDNFRPGVMERMGLGHERLMQLNPRLISASITGFGTTGPYRDRPGFDQIAQGMGGLMSITGEPGRGPMRAGIALADTSSGLMLAQGILVALFERTRSGRGQRVETSLLAAQIFMLDFQAARWLNEGEVAGQMGNDHPTLMPTGAYRTADGHITIGTLGHKIWVRLCETLRAPELADDPRFATAELRSTHRAALNAGIEAALRVDTSAAWVERLNAAGVPSGPIYSIDQVFTDDHVTSQRLVADIATAEGQELYLVAQPMTLSRTPSQVTAPPPEHGEHTAEILSQFGFDAREIDTLQQSRVVTQRSATTGRT
jgi:crotonobetainyl-CoA:carnitine CoA-transferase CaiB-like acyl-CoA transferase